MVRTAKLSGQAMAYQEQLEPSTRVVDGVESTANIEQRDLLSLHLDARKKRHFQPGNDPFCWALNVVLPNNPSLLLAKVHLNDHSIASLF